MPCSKTLKQAEHIARSGGDWRQLDLTRVTTVEKALVYKRDDGTEDTVNVGFRKRDLFAGRRLVSVVGGRPFSKVTP